MNTTYKQYFEKITREIKFRISCRRVESKATLKDIRVLLEDTIKNQGFKATQQTKLYIKHGGEYCSILMILEELEKEGIMPKLKKLYAQEHSDSLIGLKYKTTPNDEKNRLLVFDNIEKATKVRKELMNVYGLKPNHPKVKALIKTTFVYPLNKKLEGSVIEKGKVITIMNDKTVILSKL